MKLLVFAHKPPPHHGQSYMVQLMLGAFGGDYRRTATQPKDQGITHSPIECYHVNCRLSGAMDDIGQARLGKVVLLLKYCCEALWCRFRYNVRCLYYAPARVSGSLSTVTGW